MLMDVRDFKDPKVRKLVRQERIKADTLDLFGENAPAELLTPYPLDDDGLARNEKIQQKYANRAKNIQRCWNRVQLYFPELIGAEPQDVLEMSTAHGGMLEVLRHFGHNVMGTDYANMVWSKDGGAMAQFRALNDENFQRDVDDFGNEITGEKPDWPYRHIVESVDLPMTVFDAGIAPYPFADKSMDVTMCFQAIEHYCHPDDWMSIVDEFCRISRKTVFVMLNRLIPEFRAKEDYKASFDDFRLQMRSYRKNGFVCTGSFIHWDQALGFKLTAQ
ncbi:hypothetical protein [Aestuariibius sp. HNIBRBA575]|uniref:hypothetical protein n=1 Tax=Aestuariibius sp. HNIBRBA575 TaxID=3233343 RepID=UPI0034A17CFA